MKLLKLISKRYGIYQCKCGIVKKFDNYHVKSGASKSCGCYNIERIIERNTNNHEGKIVNKYKLLKKTKKSSYEMECVSCGNKKVAQVSATKSCKICTRLNHYKTTNYSGRVFESKIILQNVLVNNKFLWEVLDKETGELLYYNTYRVRRKLIPQVRIAHTVRARLKNILKLKSIKNKDTTAALIGCSYSKLCEHLSSQFDKNMNWDNYATYWEIDHIVPLGSVDLTVDSEKYRVCNYKNLRPLSKKDHKLKSSKEKTFIF